MLPWNDENEDGDELVIWLVGGEDNDVEAFLDALEQNDDHTHDGESDHAS
jgi:hypothetical protein